VARRWSLCLMAGLLAGAVVLSGCSEKQEASPSLPTAGATPTQDELPPLGPEDLPMPDEARTQDAAGAEAFVRYYIELINRTSDVMDAEPLREFSDGCQDCTRIADNVEEDMAAGYSYEGGGITVTAFGEPLLRNDTAEMALGANLAALSVLNRSGAPVPDEGSVAFTGLTGGAAARWDPNLETWLMTGLTLG